MGAAKKRAVDAPRTDAFLMDPYQLIIVGHDTDDGPEHPLYDRRIKRPLDPALIDNMMTHGVRVPVTGRAVDGEIYVVDGRRRVLHARAVHAKQAKDGIPANELIRVKVLMERGSDVHMMSIARTCNSFRVDETILEKAEHAQRLLSMGRSEKDVGITYGVDEATVRAWLSLTEADTALRKAVDDGKIAPSAAYRLVRLPRADQRKALDELLASGNGSIREARRIAAKRAGRGDTVGANRRTLRVFRDIVREIPDENEHDSEEFLAGVRATLDFVLGAEDGKLDTRIKPWIDKANRMKAKAKKDREAKAS